jgi:protein involved in polysaccharide export with SLBB domain
MSVPNAIALAGGYTEHAAESAVYIRHQGETKGQDVPADESTRVRPGDVVRVERSTYWSVVSLFAPLISPLATVAYLLK